MVNNPIIPLDNFNISQEVKQTESTKKVNPTVHRLEQGKETFDNYSFSDAVQELDELFKSG